MTADSVIEGPAATTAATDATSEAAERAARERAENTSHGPVVAVGIDGSECARHAARWAAAEAERRGAQLLVVHAYNIPTGYYGVGLAPSELFTTVETVAAKIVERAKAELEAEFPNLLVTTTARREYAVELLREVSATAELTVVGSHGHSQFADAVLGSVSARLAAHAKGPVAVIRTSGKAYTDSPSTTTGPVVGGTTTGPVVVGLDGSPESDLALGFAFEEARLRKVPLVAVTSWDDTALDAVVSVTLVPPDQDLIETQTRSSLSAQLVGWTEKYPDVRVRSLVATGRPAASLARIGDQPNMEGKPSMIVVGTRGRGGFTGLLLGSTSQALIAHATCPVVVIGRECAGRNSAES